MHNPNVQLDNIVSIYDAVFVPFICPTFHCAIAMYSWMRQPTTVVTTNTMFKILNEIQPLRRDAHNILWQFLKNVPNVPNELP
jgi:hypothetical protein